MAYDTPVSLQVLSRLRELNIDDMMNSLADQGETEGLKHIKCECEKFLDGQLLIVDKRHISLVLVYTKGSNDHPTPPPAP